MASKVNTRFVLILAGALAAMFVVAAVLVYTVVNKTGSTWAAKGEEAASRGDWKTAADMYERAVGHEQSNTAWLRKWRDALAQWTPPTESEFIDVYRRQYSQIIRQIAAVEQTVPASQREMLDLISAQARLMGARADDWEGLASMADTALQRLDPSDPETEKLRRHRGLAGLARMRLVDVRDEDRAKVLEDLRAASKADPSDVESALGVMEWLAAEAARSLRAGRVEESEARWQEAATEAGSLLERFPTDPRVMLREWELRVDRSLNEAINAAERRQTLEGLSQRLEAIVEATKAAPPEVADQAFLQRLAARLESARPADAGRLWLAAIDAQVAKAPDASGLRLLRGLALTRIDEQEEAVKQFDEVAALPMRPISLPGMLLIDHRRSALVFGAESTLRRWESTPASDAAGRAALMTELKRRRDELSGRIGERTPGVLKLDGMIASAEGRHSDAVKRFSDLSVLLGTSDLEALYLLAGALVREGSLGAAVQQYDRIIDLDPDATGAMMAAAQIDLQLERLGRARERFDKVLTLDPDNVTAKQQLRLVEALARGEAPTADQASRPTARTAGGREEPIQVDDPVVQAILDSRAMRVQAEPDFAKAARTLDEAIAKFPSDHRLAVERVALEVQRGDMAAARALTDAAAARLPESAEIRRLKIQMDNPDPVKAGELIIAESDLPELEKLKRLYTLRRQAGQAQAAAETLAKAVALAPEDDGLLEFRFVDALERNDLAAARDLAARAASRNLDQVGGLIYQARLEMVQKQYDAAIATLQRATDQNPFSAPALRLLGQANIESGRIDAGLDALRRAVDIRPNDLAMARPYVAALTRLGRLQDALEVTRRLTRVGAADEQMAEVWVTLEDQVGDKKVAAERRQRRYDLNPQDVENKLSLARILLDLKRFDEAQKIIETFPADGAQAGMRTLFLARMDAERGDLEGARARMMAHYETLTERPDRSGTLLALGDLLLQFGRVDQAVEAFTAARDWQSKEMMEADRRLGDLYFQYGRSAEAAAAYQGVVDAGADTDHLVGKRIVESLVRLGRWEEAERAALAVEKASGARDLQTALLLSDIASGKGDKRAAANYIDEAIRLAPTDALPFIRRARLYLDDPEQASLVMRDLEQALKLRPGLTLARQMRAMMFQRQGRPNEAIAELEEAVKASPDDDGVRFELLNALAASGRMDEALRAADDAVTRRGDAQPAWRMHAGDLYTRAGNRAGALRHYRDAHARGATIETLGRLVDALLRVSPPQPDEAGKAIAGMPAEQVGENNEPVVRMLSARVAKAQGKDKDAQALMRQAWESVKASPVGVRIWFDQADALVGTTPSATAAFVESLGIGEAEWGPVGRIYLAQRLSSDRSRWEEILSSLAGLETQVQDPGALISLRRTRGSILYFTQRHREAADEWRAAIEMAPNDPEFNNNLAYVLAKELNDPSAATPFAERAAQVDPNNASVLDTLGWLYILGGRLEAATVTLERALSLATSDDQRLPIRVHLAQVKRAQNDRGAAREHLDEARRLAAANELVGATYRQEIEELIRTLGGAE